MVNKESAFGILGIYEWIIIRISGILIFLYVICVSSFIIYETPIKYELWREFFNKSLIKIFTILTFMSIAIHSWIGLWQIITDYIKSESLRLKLEIVIFLILFAYIIYGIKIII
ncbi:sdhD [Wigglesworthia glossinidia endosymbiont of Glossina brevipalpis]|uniref:Succinate dehydrogenase hydrophobic membrane anchor subunit n=1 Tax=Wigglesworthia glossinidia brevipalpis TaxID=36870 RepID=Q8D2D2_WIGBR|nr:sdhD [Wigglesworthia glossinidia endosymbiont of Glossina brevipalpis]